MGEPGTKEILSLEELEAVAGLRTGRKHVLSILVENKPGVLTRIAGEAHVAPINRDEIKEPTDTVARELALFKVAVDGAQRAEVMQICEIFRGKVVDVTKRSIILEITGTTDKVEAFERMVRPFGLIEMMRTGEIAISRGRGET